MSLLSHKEIRVALGPGKFTAMVLSKGLRTRILAQSIMPVSAQSPSDWRPVLQAFQAWLSGLEIKPANISVQLSDCFVRYAMLPFDESVYSAKERLTVASLHFESIYGDAARQWKIALDDVQYGKPNLIAAIDAELAEAIEQLAEACHGRITSTRTSACDVINASCKQLQNETGIICIAEPGQSTIFDLRLGNLCGVRKASAGSNAGEAELVPMLHRELLMGGAGGESAKVFLHAVDAQGYKIPKTTGLEIVEMQLGKSGANFGAGYEILGREGW